MNLYTDAEWQDVRASFAHDLLEEFGWNVTARVPPWDEVPQEMKTTFLKMADRARWNFLQAPDG